MVAFRAKQSPSIFIRSAVCKSLLWWNLFIDVPSKQAEGSLNPHLTSSYPQSHMYAILP